MRRVLFLLPIAILAASCMRGEVSIDVEPNGAGDVNITAAVEQIKAEQFAGLIGDLCGEMVDAAIEDPAVSRYTSDGFCGIQGVARFADPSQIDFEARRALGPAADFLVNPIIVSKTDTGWSFRYDFVPLDTARDVEADEGGELAAELLGVNDATLTVRMRLPGVVVEHNGEVDRDNFVVWELEPFGDPVSLVSVTDISSDAEPADDAAAAAAPEQADTSDGSSALLYVVIAVVAAAVLVLVVIGVRRRRAAAA